MHSYPIKKLSHREVWRIGQTDDLYLLSYQVEPFEWTIFPYNDNIASIITYSLTTA